MEGRPPEILPYLSNNCIMDTETSLVAIVSKAFPVTDNISKTYGERGPSICCSMVK